MAGTRYESSLPGAVVVTETQEDRDRLHRPVGAEPDVEERLRALQLTDERQQAEINVLRESMGNERLDTITAIGSLTDRVRTAEAKTYTLEQRLVALEASQSPRSDQPYNFKALQELAWAVGTVIVTVLLQALADVENVTDWKAWAIGVGAACLRAVLGLILAQGHVTSGVEPTSHVPTSGGARHS